jgi:hypothetical protein
MEVFERPTLAQVFRRFHPVYRRNSQVTAEQRRAAWSIQVCRTPALGVLAQYAQTLEEAESEGGDLLEWTPTCPDCGGPLRYVPRRLGILRPDDTS